VLVLFWTKWLCQKQVVEADKASKKQTEQTSEMKTKRILTMKSRRMGTFESGRDCNPQINIETSNRRKNGTEDGSLTLNSSGGGYYCGAIMGNSIEIEDGGQALIAGR